MTEMDELNKSINREETGKLFNDVYIKNSTMKAATSTSSTVIANHFLQSCTFTNPAELWKGQSGSH